MKENLKNDVDINPIIGQVIAKWYKQRFGWNQPRVSIERHYDDLFARLFGRSQIYYVGVRNDTTDAEAQFALKIYRTEDAGRRELHSLSEVARHFEQRQGPFGVPTPIAYFPELRGILMSRILGERLDKLIWPSRIRGGKPPPVTAIKAVERAASWLAEYQKIACHGGQHRNLRGYELKLDLQTALHSCRSRLRSGIVEVIERWLQNMEGSLLQISSVCVPVPDAFKPDHIFVTREKTCVVDFEEESCGWPGEAPAIFLAYLDLKWAFQTEFWLKTVRRHFLQAYASQVQFDSSHKLSLEICYALELLNAFLAPWEGWGSTKLSESSWLERRFMWWKSRSAKKLIIRRSATGIWQSVVSS
jgi:hypothetical protein